MNCIRLFGFSTIYFMDTKWAYIASAEMRFLLHAWNNEALLPEFNNYSKKWTKIDESFAKMHAEKIITHQKKIACGITLGRESPLTSVKNVSNRTHTRDMFMLKIKWTLDNRICEINFDERIKYDRYRNFVID